MSRFADRLTDPRPLLFDGGFGTQLFVRGVELPNSSLANQSHADAVVDVHRAYLAAGADVIETNTFVASSLHLEMADAGEMDSAKLARLATQHARRAAEEVGDREIYVAGALGPSPGAIEADAGDTEFGIADSKVRDAHERIATELMAGGVDFFLVETMFSAREAAIAVDVARQFGLPIGVSLTYKFTQNRKTGEVIYRTDWGHGPPEVLQVLASGEHSDGVDLLPFVQMLGLNCGAESTREDHSGMAYAIEGGRQTLAAVAAAGLQDLRLIAYPNAGLPKMDRKTQETYYLQGPEDMAGQLPSLLATGAWMVGGCCGTTPDHISAFRAILDQGVS